MKRDEFNSVLAILARRDGFTQRIGNLARANEWLQSGEYERVAALDCRGCGGWCLIRKDENAAMTVHFGACPHRESSSQPEKNQERLIIPLSYPVLE